MRTIAIVNQKGGCGKTITSINLSAFLALQNKVLLVDMNRKASATLGLSPNAVPLSKPCPICPVPRLTVGYRNLGRR